MSDVSIRCMRLKLPRAKASMPRRISVCMSRARSTARCSAAALVVRTRCSVVAMAALLATRDAWIWSRRASLLRLSRKCGLLACADGSFR